eukprot:SAG31_NODE_46300_length_255_cov_0.660256_1_plen_67_part_01
MIWLIYTRKLATLTYFDAATSLHFVAYIDVLVHFNVPLELQLSLTQLLDNVSAVCRSSERVRLSAT